jgi:hypothetical protein
MKYKYVSINFAIADNDFNEVKKFITDQNQSKKQINELSFVYTLKNGNLDCLRFILKSNREAWKPDIILPSFFYSVKNTMSINQFNCITYLLFKKCIPREYIETVLWYINKEHVDTINLDNYLWRKWLFSIHDTILLKFPTLYKAVKIKKEEITKILKLCITCTKLPKDIIMYIIQKYI